MTGTLYGIGVGPGDPELITVKALRRLAAADVVAYPASQDGISLARSIVADHLEDDRPQLAIRLPFCVDPAPARAAYDRAADDIAGHLTAGRDVAVLCEGDPLLYGSFIPLCDRLAEAFPIEVVPGITSVTACAAAGLLPLAERNDVLTVLPAPLPEAALAERLAAGDAAAIVKLGRHLGKVRTVLDRLGLGARAHYVEHATRADQRSLPLREVAGDSAPYFAMVLVHRRREARP